MNNTEHAGNGMAPQGRWYSPTPRLSTDVCAGKLLTPIVDNVWGAERPFMWNRIDVGGRSAVIRLSDGKRFSWLMTHIRRASAAMHEGQHVRCKVELATCKFAPKTSPAFTGLHICCRDSVDAVASGTDIRVATGM